MEINEYKSCIANLKNLREGISSNGWHKIFPDYQYNIPIYQRLYVWGHEPIKTLLDDLARAYKTNPAETYYLGSIVVVRKNQRYDMIDGQQRFTTIWLISNIIDKLIVQQNLQCENHLNKFALTRNSDLRLSFSIREGIKDFFMMLSHENPSLDKKKEFQDIDTISEALRQIQTYFSLMFKVSEPNEIQFSINDLERFTKFLYEQIELTFIEVPETADLNKLFEVINSRGLQLEQHEILKVRMKYYLEENTEAYIQLWNACSEMNEYIEENIKYQTKSTTWDDLLDLMSSKDGTDFGDGEGRSTELSFSSEFVNKYCEYFACQRANKGSNQSDAINKEKESSKMSLHEILTDNINYSDDIKEKKSKKPVESIISFNLLLLHSLRLFLLEQEDCPDFESTIDFEEKHLLRTFNKYFFDKFTSKQLKELVPIFIKKIIYIRLIFDQHVIKKVDTEKGLEYQIRSMKKYWQDKSCYPQRSELVSERKLSMLQSMLFHSQSKPHYWLTPYLYYLQNGEQKLPLIDNYFYCSNIEGSQLLKGKLLIKENPSLQSNNFQFFVQRLEEENKEDYGKYGSYVFYKTEYILWSNRGNIFSKEGFEKEHVDLWNDFQFSYKNSVEHINPQSPPEGTDQLAKNILHDFGNLVLITTSINSSYGKLPVSEKREKFNTKLALRKIDSLKSYMIFKFHDWSDFKDLEKTKQNISEHKKMIVQEFKSYFKIEQNA